MKKISDKDYEQFLRFKRKSSLDATLNLEDDIDFPIRNSVAILALAGCTPMFSCCGFDYEGQPFHKSHQYGEPFIMLKKDPITIERLGRVQLELTRNNWLLSVENGVIYLKTKPYNNPFWDDPKSIHFPEFMVIALNRLEQVLFTGLHSYFLDEVILEDTNKNHNTQLKYWQYTPKNPWVITLDSLTL